MESVDTNYLISAGWNVPTPFRMTVPKPGCGLVEIECVEIYRLLPGKRIVMLARDQGEPILVKAFLGRNAKRNAAREVRGIEAIAKAGVCTPDITVDGGDSRKWSNAGASFLTGCSQSFSSVGPGR